MWWVGFCEVDSIDPQKLLGFIPLISCSVGCDVQLISWFLIVESEDGEVAGGGGGAGLLLCCFSAASFGGGCADLRESGGGCGVCEQSVL